MRNPSTTGFIYAERGGGTVDDKLRAARAVHHTQGWQTTTDGQLQLAHPQCDRQRDPCCRSGLVSSSLRGLSPSGCA